MAYWIVSISVLILSLCAIVSNAAPTNNTTDSRPSTIVRTQTQTVGSNSAGEHVRTTVVKSTNYTVPATINSRYVRSPLNGTAHDESSEEDASSETGSPKKPLYRPYQYQPQIPPHSVIGQSESGVEVNTDSQRNSQISGIIGGSTSSGVRTASTNQTRPVQPSTQKVYGVPSDDQ